MNFPRNYWYPILASSKLAQKKPLRLRRFSEELVLWRKSDGTIACLPDRCPHRGTSLALGKKVGECIECPMHGFRYDSDGACKKIPANGTSPIPKSFRTKPYVVREDHGYLWLWWGDERREYPALPWFHEMDTTYPYFAKSSWDGSPISFFRTMEANLDVIHFPFVHPPSRFSLWLARRFPKRLGFLDIGPVADPFRCEVQEDETIFIEWDLRHDHQERVPYPPMRLWVRFPNQLMVDVPRWKARGYFGCAPIDENSTFFAAGYSQGFCRIPVLGRLAAWWLLNKVVLGPITAQDLRLQATQTPTDIGMSRDLLIAHGDRGVAEYWKLVRKSQPAASNRSIEPSLAPRETPRELSV